MAAVHFTTIPSEPNTANYTYQPRPQGFSLKKWVGREKGKALGTRLVCVIGIYLFLGGGGAKFVPLIATLPILGLKFIKLFCAFI